MELSGRHWLAALAAAGLLHAGALSAALWPRPPVDSGSTAFGGIAVSLGAPSTAPSQIIEPVSSMAETLDAVNTTAPIEPVNPVDVETLEPTEPIEMVAESSEPPPVDEPAILEVVEAATPEEPAVEPDAVEMEEPVIETVEVVELRPVPETPQIEAVVEPPPDPEIATALETIPSPPPPPARPAAPPPPRVQAPAPDPAPAPEPAPQIAAIDPSAGPPSPPATAPATGGAGAPGTTADYAAQLQAWLERHKEYPRRARQRRQEGVALLYFAIDRSGRVLRAQLQQTTGHNLLDREVLAMVQRAQPLPPMPDSMTQQQLELIIPVEFFLR